MGEADPLGVLPLSNLIVGSLYSFPLSSCLDWDNLSYNRIGPVPLYFAIDSKYCCISEYKR